MRKKLFRSLAIAKVSTAAVGVSFGMLASYPVAALEKDNTAKITKSATPITNELGAIRYIVQLDDGRKIDATTPSPRTVSKVEVESSLESVKRATEALVADVSNPVSAKSLRTTALLMPTFLAYLDEVQVKQLIADKRVLKLEQDTYVQTSNIWNNSASGGQVDSWGIAAMGLSNPNASNGVAKVFVLDTGIVPHIDLPQFTANCGVPRFHRTVTRHPIIRFWMFKAAITTLASYDFHAPTALVSYA